MEKTVSVVIPCRNEEKYIQRLLVALSKQSFSLENIEIIIADGESQDRTVKLIRAFISNNPKLKIRIVNNSKKNIPSALNLAIKSSSGEIIIRMDAHSIPHEDYIKYCVDDLEQKKGMNVGGLWLIKPSRDHWISESIALAASHPFGVGDAKYRYSQEFAYVETVPFGAFFRSTFDKIGFFNEELLSNEDYELNVRITNSGGRIFFDPRIKIDYYARGDFISLAKQYWRYGFWKFKMLQKFPDTIRWRQAIPPLFVVSLIFLAIASIFLPLAFLLLLGELGIYLLLLVTGSLRIVFEKNRGIFILGIPFSIMVMHLSWGSGFITSMFRK